MDESRETVKRTIEATVEVNTDEAMEQTEKLIALLVTANSLADELAVTLHFASYERLRRDSLAWSLMADSNFRLSKFTFTLIPIANLLSIYSGSNR